MKIRSYVGGHDVVLYRGAVYDRALRKYRGGTPVAIIPYAGRMLSAQAEEQTETWITLDGAEIPLHSAIVWQQVDPLPGPEECDFALVSHTYVTACQSLGMDTSRLLTVGGAVVDEAGQTVGCAWLNRN